MIDQKEENRQRRVLTVAHNDYAKGMNSYSFFKVHNHATGTDLVQDTFMKTWSYLAKGGKINIMKAFLYHVLNQLIIDEYRKKKSTSLEVLIEKGYEPSIDSTQQILNIFDGKTAILLIQHLPEKYRAIMKMKYVQDLSLKEISLITGQTKNAVTVQTHRGLAKLKALYNRG